MKAAISIILLSLLVGCASLDKTTQIIGVNHEGNSIIEKISSYSDPGFLTPSIKRARPYLCIKGAAEDGSKDRCEPDGKALVAYQKGMGPAIAETALEGAAFVGGMAVLRPATARSNYNEETYVEGSEQGQGQGQEGGYQKTESKNYNKSYGGEGGEGGEGKGYGYGGKGGKGGDGYGYGGKGYGGEGGDGGHVYAPPQPKYDH